ncbi:MAG: chloride channel protein, partial [Candidatus Omnitrophica bacterium]|nr:chloride channel protein [Candidatus Omnitrophota bacterium]
MLFNRLLSSLSHVEFYRVGRWFIMAMAIGTIAATGALVFEKVQDFVETRFLGEMSGFHPPHPHTTVPGDYPPPHDTLEPGASGWGRSYTSGFFLVLIPTLGGLVSGFLIYIFAPEAEGHGTDSVIKSYHRQGGRIRWQVPLVKLFASAITIGSGGSAGREGPIAQIGAGFGSLLGSWTKVSDREKRILVLAGVAAGIGAMFKAPLGGALFAAEVLYRDPEFEYEALIPAFISSILAYSLYCLFSGSGFNTIFSIPVGMKFTEPVELIFYGVMGVFLALVGILYVKSFSFFRHKVFAPMPIPNLFKPMLGGFILGLLALAFPQILGVSYGYLEEPLTSHDPATRDIAFRTASLFLLLGFLKIYSTCLTIGSGGSGGVFAPSLVIGGSFGAAFGTLFAYYSPDYVSQPGAYVLVGMGGFFSGVAKVPITALIMVCEMTSGYGLVVPLMLVTAVTYVLTPNGSSIYEEQVQRRIDSPAHAGEFMIDVLENVRVSEVMEPLPEVVTIREDTPLGEVLKLSTETVHQAFPVMNHEGKLAGVVSLDDVRSYYYESEL